MVGRFETHQRRGPSSDDGGFTIAEVVVAIVLVTIVMTSLAAFFVNGVRVTNTQGQRQAASRVASDAIDLARSLVGVGLTHNRDQTSSQALWDAGTSATGTTFPGVKSYLDSLTMAYDKPQAPLPAVPAGSGYTAALPICVPGVTSSTTCVNSGATVSRDGRAYTRNWFLGCVNSSTPDCRTSIDSSQPSFLQVVVAVTWSDASCPNSTCSYITATTLSTTVDPLFDQTQTAPKPKITNPGGQTSYVGDNVMLAIQVTGGTAPLTWTPPTNLPAGLSWGNGSSACPGVASGVCIYGRPTTIASSVSITLAVSDGFDYSDTATFNWTVGRQLVITSPSSLAAYSGSTANSLSITAAATGGTAPYTWSASNIPSGMSMNASTGQLSGKPGFGNRFLVVIMVTDKTGAQASVVVVLTVTGDVIIHYSPDGERTTPVNQSVSLPATVSGGYSQVGGVTNSWTGYSLPPGVSISATTGQLSGRPTQTGAWAVTVLCQQVYQGVAYGYGYYQFIWTIS